MTISTKKKLSMILIVNILDLHINQERIMENVMAEIHVISPSVFITFAIF
jgi:hypothetical protein